MKTLKLFAFIAFIILLSAHYLYAAPVGNIARLSTLKSAYLRGEWGELGLFAGSEFDFTMDRKIKHQYADTKMNFYGGRMGVSIWDKIMVYGLLGSGDIEIKLDVSGDRVEWESEAGLVWGVGTTIILYETKLEKFYKGTLRFGVDARYRRYDPDIKRVVLNSTAYDLPHHNVSGASINQDEWQLALCASYQIDRFIPYAGVKYSDVDGKAKATIVATKSDKNYDADNICGIFIGTDVLILDSLSVNVEGRIIDEEALTLGCNFRF